MSAVSLPVTRPPVGRALIVAHPSSRASLVERMARDGFECGECEDPYTATLELARRKLSYSALILSLASLYREELALIATVKRRFPHLEIWLAHTDGRLAALAEAMRLGADGLLDDEGRHRIAAQPAHETVVYQSMPISSLGATTSLPEPPKHQMPRDAEMDATHDMNGSTGEPVLTADELRALLQDQPPMPPSGSPQET
jgi:hypothetical protein